MSFTVTLTVPRSLSWDDLAKSFRLSLERREVSPDKVSEVTEYFAHLLRLSSWQVGIDWNPQQNKVTVPVPNDFLSHETINDNGIKRDGLVSMMQDIYRSYDADKVLQFFSLNK